MNPFLLHAHALIATWAAVLVPGTGAPAPPASNPAASAVAPAVRNLPPIVFVARAPSAEPGAVPGLGPHHRARATGGRLLLRTPDGSIRALLPEGAFHDCADPTVAFDGRRVAFAGTVHPDSAWRIWIVGNDGTGLTRVSPYFAVSTFFTVYPGDITRPFSSNINVTEGVNVPNMAVIKLGANGEIRAFNNGGYIHYLFDVSAGVLAD